MFRIRSVAAAAIHRFFQEQGFVYVNTPIITTSDCEGAGEMFRVTTLDPKNPPLTESGEVDWSQDFFDKHASLTVSGQLNAENFAMAFGDVYTFGPTFRAENSNTTRHAAEFWMIEPEMAFADLNDYMDNAEAMLKYVLKDVMATCPDELNMLNKFVDKGLLEARIKDLGMNPEQYKYYLDLRRYGSCKHAGYGLGFERLVMYLTGVGNIRDVLPHPRTVGNADF